MLFLLSVLFLKMFYFHSVVFAEQLLRPPEERWQRVLTYKTVCISLFFFFWFAEKARVEKFRCVMSVNGAPGPVYLQRHYARATQTLMKNRSAG